MNQPPSRKTRCAVAKYGLQTCVEAYEQHEKRGDGAATIGFSARLTTRQADAAIDAGRELAEIEKRATAVRQQERAARLYSEASEMRDSSEWGSLYFAKVLQGEAACAAEVARRSAA